MGVKIGKVRYLSCSIVWLTLFTFYAMRSNISIAILSMSKQTSSGNISTFSSCVDNSSKESDVHSQESEFNWTQAQQGKRFLISGHILGSFFIGYFSTHLLGAVMSHIIGPRWVMIISLFGATVFTYLMLILPYIGVNYFIFGRMMIGVFSVSDKYV
ncbi:hypothetical protein RF11_02324 [Thelohanellus kitauei]|uniref:Sialin n=1 Tax=Thelohanellus kitauei TaxID=669202 RepID=A0A0C2N0Y3_THEKT|nr:hypothetical protein RF11_02324 [Thelohanellus kitauei]